MKINFHMRQNEQDVLNHLRSRAKEGHPVNDMMFFNRSWRNALKRLQAAGKVKYVRSKFIGHYVAKKGARPVTKVAK